MNKKKAIKIATASVMAASSFAAIAPFTTEAAVNVSASVTKATTQMKKAQDTYTSAAAKGQVASAATVQKQVDLAKKYYDDAKKVIAKSGGKNKAAYTKKLTAALPYYNNAKNYIAGVNYASALKDQGAKFEAAAQAGKVDAKAFATFSAELAKADKKVKDAVYGGTSERAVIAKYVAPAKKSAAAVSASVKAVSAIKDIQAVQGDASVVLPKTVEVTLVNGKKAQKEVKWNQTGLDLNKVGEYTVTGVVAGTKLPATVKVVVAAPAVTSVTAITKTNVTFTIPALTADTTGYTVEVLDNNGNKVEVNPVNLEKGETDVTLTFKTPFGVDPTGVWTVGGLKYDLDVIANYNAIVTAASTNNEVTTLAALKKAGLTNVKDENITAYVTAINASTTKEKLADIQKIVDTTNSTNVTASEAAAAVKAVNDATNQVGLLAALQNKAFARVNAEWVVDYNTAITTAKATPTNTDTVVEIQALVDGVNATKIGAANTAADTVAKQNVVTDLISKYTIDDVAPATTKADAIKASNVKSAVFGVKEATTAATVYNALVKLSTLDSANLPASALNVNLKSLYLAENVATGGNAPDFTSTATVRLSIVNDADAAALSNAADGIVALTTTSTTSEVKSALQKLADVTSHTSDKFDMTKVKDASLADYLTVLEPKIKTAVDTASEVTALIAGVNGTANANANIATLKSASSTVAQVRDALTELAAGATLPNATATAYLNASSQVKLEVAQFVIDNRADLATSLTSVIVVDTAGTTYADAPLKTALADHAAQVTKFNAIDDLAAATISTTKTALDTYAYAPYEALTTSQKLAVAEEINKLTKPVTSGGVTTNTALDFGGVDAVVTLAQANAYIDAAIKTVLGK
ncbi:Ig-like domain-containing protein [Neobacillus niacini]|uniref:Ig-like domain-containing protein n=1 Tax=Neobacillus niacini TaxID=86668 RepID=UPI002858714D|nr:Ig-like domain-containing protein [Neobacillus niacini]MDR7000077.1 hypothetical protein [Neobacillus niacini]